MKIVRNIEQAKRFVELRKGRKIPKKKGGGGEGGGYFKIGPHDFQLLFSIRLVGDDSN